MLYSLHLEEVRLVAVLRDRRGITLVETLVVLVLIGIIMAALTTFLTTSLNLFGRGDRQTEVQQQARIAMNHLRNDLTAARSVEVSDVNAGGTLVALIERPVQGESEELEVRYTLENRTLYRDFKGSKNPIALEMETAAVNSAEGTGGLFQVRVVSEKGEARAELETKVKPRNIP